MSDTDDTDVLIQIPPDLFMVNTSDSEDSIGTPFYGRRSFDNGHNQRLVNNLLDQVTDLETRIGRIEEKNVPGSKYIDKAVDCYLETAPNYPHWTQEDTESESNYFTSHKFGGSLDNINIPIPGSVNGTPVKSKHLTSLPSTPYGTSRVIHRPRYLSNSYHSVPVERHIDCPTPQVNTIMASNKSAESSNRNASTSSGQSVSHQSADDGKKQNHPRINTELMEEIDNFLDSVKKPPQTLKLGRAASFDHHKRRKCHKCGELASSIPDLNFGVRDLNSLPVLEHCTQEKCYRCGELTGSVPDLSFGLRDFDKLPPRAEFVASQHSTPQKPGAEQRHLKLTQEKNQQPPKLAQGAGGDHYKRRKCQKCGELASSIPDLNFGVRDLNSLPVIEHCTQERCHRCGELTGSVPDLSFGLRDFDKLPPREEYVASQHSTSLKSQKPGAEQQHLKLPQEEKTQQTLKLGKAASVDLYKRKKCYKCGELTSTIPDLNFGVRDLNSLPVIEHCTQERCHRCGERTASVPDLSFGLRDFDSLPPREEPVFSQRSTALTSQKPGAEQKHLNLPDVDKLLKEMESTQQQIEEKLRMKEAAFGKGSSSRSMDNLPFPQRLSQSGDNIASIPDRGLGIREYLTGHKADERTAAHEPRCIKRSMSLCGVNPTADTHQDTNQSSSRQKASETDVPRSLSPRRLQLGNDPSTIPDLGFGLINWYKSNDADSNEERAKQTIAQDPPAALSPGAYKLGDLPSSIPDLGFGLRDLWASGDTPASHGKEENVQPRKYAPTQSEPPRDSGTIEHASVFKSQAGLLSAAIEAPFPKKVDFRTESGFKDTIAHDEEYSGGRTVPGSNASNLLSLSSLWQQRGVSESPKDPVDLKQRIDEEKYRREHCEELIVKLQRRLLEEQQKLAVAMQVDTGKDQAIRHFHEAWTRLVDHWKDLEEQRHHLAEQLQRDRGQYQQDVADTLNKLKRYESEISKALDLAHGFKQKCETAEKEKCELEDGSRQEIQQLHNRIQEREQAAMKANQENSNILREKEELLKKLKQFEEESKKDRATLLNVKKELDKKSKALVIAETEVATLQEEKGSLQVALREEKSRNASLDQQKKSLHTALEESKKREKTTRDEVRASAGQLDKVKGELRAFYQEQVDVVVGDKLREFQGQLDAAEQMLRKELETREQAIAERAAVQVKQISDKLQMEVKLLEEKHVEELQLAQLKLAQASHQIARLQGKLRSDKSRKGELAEQLHDVMETQWQQALRIINGNGPATAQIQSTRTQTNVMEASHGTWPKYQNGLPEERDLMSLPVPPLHTTQPGGKATTNGPVSLERLGQLTYRAAEQLPSNKADQLPANDLKKYIEMLLNRPPGNPVVGDSPPTNQWKSNERQQEQKRSSAVDPNKLPQWEKFDALDTSQCNLLNGHQPSIPELDFSQISVSTVSKDSKSGKPPWK